jgi:hypothetical protein
MPAAPCINPVWASRWSGWRRFSDCVHFMPSSPLSAREIRCTPIRWANVRYAFSLVAVYKPRKNSPTPAAPQHRLTLFQYPKVCCSGIPEFCSVTACWATKSSQAGSSVQLRQSKEKPSGSSRTVAPPQIEEVAPGCLVVGDKAVGRGCFRRYRPKVSSSGEGMA